MKYGKPNRLRSKKNIEFIQSRPCAACGRTPVDAHHIRTRGAGGDDRLSNLLPLCRVHHTEIHKIGKQTFFEKYRIEQ